MNDELKLGSIILACCCFMWFYAIPNQIKGPQASLYPQSLTIVMSIISCLILIKGVRLRKNGEDGENWTFFNQATLRSLIVVPMMVERMIGRPHERSSGHVRRSPSRDFRLGSM